VPQRQLDARTSEHDRLAGFEQFSKPSIAGHGDKKSGRGPGNLAPRSRRKTWRFTKAQLRTAHRPSPARSWHRLGPRDMPFKFKRFRHVAVAIPIAAVAGLVVVGAGQQSPES
jgi:hypothetical protein